MGSCAPEVSKHFPTDLIAQFNENLAADKANDVKHVKTVLLIQATLLHDTGMDECLKDGGWGNDWFKFWQVSELTPLGTKHPCLRWQFPELCNHLQSPAIILSPPFSNKCGAVFSRDRIASVSTFLRLTSSFRHWALICSDAAG